MTDALQHVLLSGGLTFGLPLIIAVREIIVTRRSSGGWSGDPPKEPEPLPPQPEGPKRLPECLIPKLPPLPVRGRVLEDA